jgi:thymidine phosphorylase
VEGILRAVDAETLGRAAASLGAGRARKEDPVDPAVGLEFFPRVGDRLAASDRVAVVHARQDQSAEAVAEQVRGAMRLGDQATRPPPLVLGWFGGPDGEATGDG